MKCEQLFTLFDFGKQLLTLSHFLFTLMFILVLECKQVWTKCEQWYKMVILWNFLFKDKIAAYFALYDQKHFFGSSSPSRYIYPFTGCRQFRIISFFTFSQNHSQKNVFLIKVRFYWSHSKCEQFMSFFYIHTCLFTLLFKTGNPYT